MIIGVSPCGKAGGKKGIKAYVRETDNIVREEAILVVASQAKKRM